MPISEELQRRIASFTSSAVDPTKGVISNRDMELFQQASPSSGQISDQEIANMMNQAFVMDMVDPTKGAISNRDMELFQQASPSSGQISDQEEQILQGAEIEHGKPFSEE